MPNGRSPKATIFVSETVLRFSLQDAIEEASAADRDADERGRPHRTPGEARSTSSWRSFDTARRTGQGWCS
jgi:hypothetical protein